MVWQSGIYALVDCIFSARARYPQVLAMLRGRLARRPGLRDHTELRFSAFVADVDSFGTDKFERYGAEVLTRQVLAGRRKVEVCYDASLFFVTRNLETKGDFQEFEARELERLILRDLRREVRGVGPTLGRYLLMLLGREEHIKPDVMITRFFASLSAWMPRYGNQQDAEIIREVLGRGLRG